MKQCLCCDCEIKINDKFGKIAFYTNDVFNGFGIYCYSCATYYIRDFEQNEKWEICKGELDNPPVLVSE